MNALLSNSSLHARWQLLSPGQLLAVALLFILSGCASTVRESPVAGSSDGSFIRRGAEPAPAAIPQKDLPEGASSLRRVQPD